MRRRPPLVLLCLPALIAFAALGAGCGDEEPTSSGSTTTTAQEGDPTALDAITVTGDPGEKPTFEFDQPFELDVTASKVLSEGDGESAEVGDTLQFHFVFVNARDGSEVQSSFGGEPAIVPLEESLFPPVFDALEGATPGSRVLVGISPADGLGADESVGLLETDTVLFFAEVLDVSTPLQRAEGTAVDPAAGLPTVVLADDGAPTITVPGDAAPTELIVQPLIEGEGPEVEAGQTITVHYTGVLWDSGETFDSSWESGSPASFVIGTGNVIAGWDEGLVGQTVGSQILLVVPPAKGYPEGSPDGSISPTDTLVFVVDILAAG